jgi:DnaJ-class molecular chaperone
MFWLNKRCKKCRGKQVITKTKRVEFNLKKGTNPGEIIVLKDSGDQSTDFSLSGDLHIMIELSPHPTFTLQPSRNASSPADLSTTLSLTSAESRLGFSRVILTHLDGRGIKITHPAPGQIGSHPLSANDCIMIEGEGMRKDAMKGDLWIEIKVERFTSKLRGKALAALGYPLPPNRKDKPSRTVEVKFVQFDAGLHSAPEPVRFFLPSFFDQY